jgi:hypothetical protein
MKTILTALGTAGFLGLAACGGSGGGEAEANNTAAATDDLALPPENGTDPLAGTGDTLENQANALDANLSGGTDLNTSGNLSADLNATNTAGNTTNTQ